ncbi:MAG: hypothetical protein FJ148_27605, partial [Deltaproteobacteria bacterium]|nr:hypothetical protein [Deltaproteobacteria bacterium]
AEALAARGHAVAVFARALDPQRQDGETADEEVDGIPVRRVVRRRGSTKPRFVHMPSYRTSRAWLDSANAPAQ